MEDPRQLVAAMAPELTVYLASLSETVAPGLRTGFLHSPEELLERQTSIVGASAWMAPPLTAELAMSGIEDGTAERILDSRRAEAVARLALAQDKLPRQCISTATRWHHI
tara:strand:- start:1532 stop:1861 length:330 start_codon:yes stop_codon:yes gene_type:complete